MYVFEIYINFSYLPSNSGFGQILGDAIHLRESGFAFGEKRFYRFLDKYVSYRESYTRCI